MYETQNDLSQDTRLQMAKLLNARLADAIDLRTQVKVAHWNVKGPQFIALHKLFDDVATDVDEYVDLIAERAVQLGGTADGTARQVAERSSLDEYAGNGTGEQHVAAVADVLADFGKSVRQAVTTSSDAGDQDTADIFTEVSRGVDKWLWFVEAHHQAGAWAHGSAREGDAGRHPAH
jgi:starvation-inducible DNA-binding protein